MQNYQLKPPNSEEIKNLTSIRYGETKIGEVLEKNAFKDDSDPLAWLKSLQANGVQYAVLLIPEDIGPRANLGRAGSLHSPSLFLGQFLNIQANRFFDCSKVAIAGSVNLYDLQRRSENASVEELRLLCSELDKRVEEAVATIVSAGIKPIIIGGGNNNSYPVIRAIVKTKNILGGIDCINCDPHADYRLLEGRHSGNPFSYANQEGLLKKYSVLGLHESYNSEDMLTRLEVDGHKFFSFDQCRFEEGSSFTVLIDKCIKYHLDNPGPLGLELDLDSIKNMPTSAFTPVGISEEEAIAYISTFASKFDTTHLHLSEGSPASDSISEKKIVGKFIAYAVIAYLKSDLLNLQ